LIKIGLIRLVKEAAMAKEAKQSIAVKEGLFTLPSDEDRGHLIGSKCRSCGEVFFGRTSSCSYCQGVDMEQIRLSDSGKLYNFTVLRYKPPAPWKGVADPYQPFAAGFIELPEGVRILSIITDCDVDKLIPQMDMEVVVRKYYEDEAGNDVYTYMFRPLTK
jgi:uncharacterized OB-fold protein